MWAGVLEGYGYAPARDAKSAHANLTSLVSDARSAFAPQRHSPEFVTGAEGLGVASLPEEVRANVKAPPRAARLKPQRTSQHRCRGRARAADRAARVPAPGGHRRCVA